MENYKSFTAVLAENAGTASWIECGAKAELSLAPKGENRGSPPLESPIAIDSAGTAESFLIEVVIGLLIRNEKILIAQRAKHVDFGDMWEFPGGKLEANESSYAALCRELHEEIDIQVVAANHLYSFPYQYPKGIVNFHVWQVLEYIGLPRGAENQLIHWVSFADLSKLSFPEANQEMITRLSKIVELSAQ